MTAHALAPPFSEAQWRRIHTLLDELDDRQALWLSGYLAGQNTETARSEQKADRGPALLIAYGTETDNSRDLNNATKPVRWRRFKIWPGSVLANS